MIRPARLALALALTASLVFAGSAAAKPQRLPKGWAKKNHVVRTQATRDADHDGLSNWGEWRSGTDPHKKDTDHDGVRDGAEDRDHDGLSNAVEVALGTDPRTRERGELDVAGTVAALTGDSLTLRVDGGRVTAQLGADAELSCDAQADASQVDPGDDWTSDDSGDDTGDDSAGDDAGDDSGDGSGAVADDPCADALAVGADVDATLTAGPRGLAVVSIDVV